MGTMGFGLPAAIGATFGAPGRMVCLFFRRRRHSDDTSGVGHDYGTTQSGENHIAQ